MPLKPGPVRPGFFLYEALLGLGDVPEMAEIAPPSAPRGWGLFEAVT